MKKYFVSTLICVLVMSLLATTGQQQPVQTERISSSSLNQEPNSESTAYNTSDDGIFACFSSSATNLVVGDTNGQDDCFVLNRQTGLLTRVSVSTDGTQGNGASGEPMVSGNGLFVTFRSTATNLVPGDSNNFPDVFVKDLTTGQLERVSVSSSGGQANNGADWSVISGDGRYVAFGSSSNNLVPDDTNGVTDIFLRDRQLGTTVRVSKSSSGIQANHYCDRPTISSDGSLVAFVSLASNLSPNDNNSDWDVFIHKVSTGETERVSITSDGGQPNDSVQTFDMSDDGQVVVFATRASNVVPGDNNQNPDVFVRDITLGTTTRISLSATGGELVGGSGHSGVSISGDGRYAVYASQGNNIVSNDTNLRDDIFRYDRATSTTIRASVSSTGMQSNADCYSPRLSKDGDCITYSTTASSLVLEDQNGLQDAYLTFLAPPPPTSSTFLSIGDTYLKEGQPNKNQGTEGILRIRQSGQNRSLVQFDQNAISSFVGTRLVTSATLRVYISLNSSNWGASGRDVGAHRLTSNWTELGATWNCPDDTNTGNNVPDGVQWEMNNASLWPFVSTASDIVVHTNGLVGWIEFDVTADVQGFLSGNPNYGWLIKKTNEGQSGSVEYSSKDGANPPELIITAQ
jgi:hypothetical protein